MVVITAPAGYGKTSLACEWLADHPAVAWYRATTASADLAAFSVGVVEVVQPISPGAGERLRQRLHVAEAPERAVRPLAELLAEDLADWPEDAWLVIDDYHLVIDSAPVEEFMDWLLTLAPVRVLVTTRRRPAWASARRVLSGELFEISKEQLAMTNEEAARVLDGRPSDTVRTLVTQAQGWPALIGLAALSVSAEIPTERLSEGLFRYFAEEVFRREPPALQRFMLTASIPQTISARLARDVLEIDDPQVLIDELLDEGLLQDSGPDEYAFHPLLRDFLRRKLEQEAPDTARSLGERLLDHARATALWDEAFGLAMRSANPDLAAEIIGEAAESLLAAGRVETIEKWLADCGRAIIRHPTAMLAKVEVLIRQGRLSEGLELAKDVCGRLSPNVAYASRALSLAGQAAHFLSQDVEALEFHLKARERSTTGDDLRRSLWGAFLASVDSELGDAEDYLHALEAASGDDVDSRLQLATGRAVAARARGSVAGVLSTLKPLLPLAEYAIDPMIRSGFLAYASYLSSLKAQYERARELAIAAQDICDQFRLPFESVLCGLTRAHAEIGLRHKSQARLILQATRKLSHQFEDPYLSTELTVLSIKLSIAEGDLSAARVPPPASFRSRPPRSVRGELHALGALTAAASGDYARADSEIAAARSLTATVEARYIADFAELIVDVRTQGMTKAAVDALSTLVAATYRNDILDALVTSYRAFPEFLEILNTSSSVLSILQEAVLLSNDQKLARATGLPTEPEAVDARLAALTKRELEVLQLICEGLTNREIAGALVISPSTAKVHVHNIFSKLEVGSRLQAALIGRLLLDENS
jgi:ATP/maltotriose-dependent transcriptional regulator MalT